MDKWLQIWEPWAIFAAYLLVTWIVAALARRIMHGIARLLADRDEAAAAESESGRQRRKSVLDEGLMRAGTGPVRLVVLVLGLHLAIDALILRLPAMGAAPEFRWVERGVGALLVLAITYLINALMRVGLQWYLYELSAGSGAAWTEILPVVRRLLSLVLYFIAISIILKDWGTDITALVTTAGVASLAIALAAQETLSNMLGGLIILVDRPFRIGDTIELSDGKSGEVVEIGLRSTRIAQFDGNALVVPNKDMANSRIINYALPTQKAVVRASLGVSYQTDVEQAKAVLLSVLTGHPDVLQEPAPFVLFTKIGESWLELSYGCWVQSYRDRGRVGDEINSQILASFRTAGIALAHPQRDVKVQMVGQ
ncbi:MAG: mechanosensitive ion channel family protein [Mycobacterium leprae]